jgi:ATP-dependent Clp protease ATP-binding subunit ClpB
MIYLRGKVFPWEEPLMRPDKFTLKSQEVLEAAQNVAAQRGNPQVDTEHLLLALLADDA